MPEENVEIVRTVFEAMRSGDKAAWRARIDPELRIEPSAKSPEQRMLEGFEGFDDWISRWPALFEHHEVHPERFSVEGDDVVVALHERVKSARSEITFEDHFAHVWTVRRGLVVRIRVFDDEAEALETVRERR